MVSGSVRRITAEVLVLTLLAACSGPASEDTPLPASPAGVLVYTVGDGTVRIRDLGAAGTDRELQLPFVAPAADWSADGTRAAYVEDDTLFVADADGSSSRSVIHRFGLTGRPSWSPDGTRIALTQITGLAGSRVLVVDVRSRRARPVEGLPKGDWTDLAWSPEGTRLAVGGSPMEAGAPGIFVGPIAGGGFRRVSTEGQDEFGWSAVADRLVYASTGPRTASGDLACSDRGWKIFTVAPDGSDRRRVTEWTGFEAEPVWSPDGAWIVYASDEPPDLGARPCEGFDGSLGNIWVVHPDGTAQQVVIQGPGHVLDWVESWDVPGGQAP